MIRTDIAQFTLLWNSHSIRPQPNRPHVNPGIPQDLYNTDEIRNWGVPIAEGSAEEQVLRTMYEPLQEIEIDEFMDQETQEWCKARLAELNFDPASLRTEEDYQRPHLQVYLQLRRIVREHIDSRQEPQLAITPAPIGGTERYVSILEHLLSYDRY
jgi:hypothetical protein